MRMTRIADLRELLQVRRVPLQLIERHHFQGFLVRGRQHNLRRCTRFERFLPACDANAPAIAWLQSRKVKFWMWCHKIVTALK